MTAEYVEPTEAEVEAAANHIYPLIEMGFRYSPIKMTLRQSRLIAKQILISAAKVRAQQQESGK